MVCRIPPQSAAAMQVLLLGDEGRCRTSRGAGAAGQAASASSSVPPATDCRPSGQAPRGYSSTAAGLAVQSCIVSMLIQESQQSTWLAQRTGRTEGHRRCHHHLHHRRQCRRCAIRSTAMVYNSPRSTLMAQHHISINLSRTSTRTILQCGAWGTGTMLPSAHRRVRLALALLPQRFAIGPRRRLRRRE